MRIELVELLSSREICHPTRIDLLESTSTRQIHIEMSGYPWWLGKTQINPKSEEKICFYFNDILDVSLDSKMFCRDDLEEDLELLTASFLHEEEWAKGVQYEIFCSSPISDSYGLYALFDDYLMSLGCPYSARDYLNMGKSFSTFKDVTSAKSYLLARAPEEVCKVICEFLKLQEVEFKVLQGREGSIEIKNKYMSCDLIYAQFSGGFIICGEAYALYEKE